MGVRNVKNYGYGRGMGNIKTSQLGYIGIILKWEWSTLYTQLPFPPCTSMKMSCMYVLHRCGMSLPTVVEI